MNRGLWLVAILSLVMSFAGCKTMDIATSAISEVGERTGTISQSQAESIRKSAVAASKSMETFTPEQEYYIGRSVGATILSNYTVLNDPGVQSYVNLLGQTIAAASDTPELFAGYHFLVLDTEEINAFATPGGHIFITHGLIGCTRTEDGLAAILAHEIAHLQLRHGMQAIEKARVTQALTVIGQEGAKTFGPGELSQLTEAFGDVVSDMANTMINKGYSRSFEYQADAAAVDILHRVGYNPLALVELLTVMDQKVKPGGDGFARTHPSPGNRIAQLNKKLPEVSRVAMASPATKRFIRNVGHLL
jgi:beta-barrel assembly-enhancing protease